MILKNRVICARGQDENSASSAFNKKLDEIGPNWTLCTVGATVVPSKDGSHILLTGLVRLGEENLIGSWPISAIGIDPRLLRRIEIACKQVAGGTNVANLTVCVRGPLLRCDRFTNKHLREIERALGEHGLVLSGAPLKE